MRERLVLHALPPLSVLGVAVAVGVLEWIGLWRSRKQRRAMPASRH